MFSALTLQIAITYCVASMGEGDRPRSTAGSGPIVAHGCWFDSLSVLVGGKVFGVSMSRILNANNQMPSVMAKNRGQVFPITPNSKVFILLPH